MMDWGAQEWLTLAAVVVPTCAVLVTSAITALWNSRAHDGITKRIDGVDARSLQRDDAHRAALESIARRVIHGGPAGRTRSVGPEAPVIRHHQRASSRAWGLLRAAVLERDDWTCRSAGSERRRKSITLSRWPPVAHTGTKRT